MKKNIPINFLLSLKNKGILAIFGAAVLVSCGIQTGTYAEKDGVYYDPSRDTLPEGTVMPRTNRVGDYYDYQADSELTQNDLVYEKYKNWNGSESNDAATYSDWGAYAGSETNYYDYGWNYYPYGMYSGFGWGMSFGWGSWYSPWHWGGYNPYYFGYGYSPYAFYGMYNPWYGYGYGYPYFYGNYYDPYYGYYGYPVYGNGYNSYNAPTFLNKRSGTTGNLRNGNSFAPSDASIRRTLTRVSDKPRTNSGIRQNQANAIRTNQGVRTSGGYQYPADGVRTRSSNIRNYPDRQPNYNDNSSIRNQGSMNSGIRAGSMNSGGSRSGGFSSGSSNSGGSRGGGGFRR